MIGAPGKGVAALCCVVALCLAAAAKAQQVPRRLAVPPAVGTAPAVGQVQPVPVSLPPAVLEVQLNKAHALDLPAPVATIVVGNENVADVHLDPDRPRQVFVVSRAIGKTNLFFMNEAGGIIHQMEVQVVFDAQGVEGALKKLLPDEKIGVTVYRDSIFLTGFVRSAATSANAVTIARRFVGDDTSVINMLKLRGSQQVILQVRVAEIDRDIWKKLSVQQGVNTSFSDHGRVILTTIPSLSTLSAFATGALSTNISGLSASNFEILEQEGLVKTLAEPTLTAISGETANFLAGGETPVPTGTDQNGNATIEYREFGVRLEFTPVVIDEGRINLRISTEISSLSTTTVAVANSTLSNIITKRTETTIELQSGGSVMISGLLRDDLTNTVQGVPFLKDIPIIGALFRSVEFLRDETELVVTVAAYLAKPTGNDAPLSLPTDGFEPASDIDVYLLARIIHAWRPI